MSTPVIPYPNSAAPKKQQVVGMFDRIAIRYDFLNHFLSMGIDHYWRRAAVNSFKNMPDLKNTHILDVATGTADLALELERLGVSKITGVDISENMLTIGRNKIEKKNLSSKINLQLADSEDLPFAEGYFNGAMAAFGVRNFANLDKGLAEIYRVVKPGGKLVVLEFSRPVIFPFKQIYSFYFSKILPFLGAVVSRDKDAYSYLHRSVTLFPDGTLFLKRLLDAGFIDTNLKPLSFGICTVYTGLKPTKANLKNFNPINTVSTNTNPINPDSTITDLTNSTSGEPA